MYIRYFFLIEKLEES